MDNKDKNIELLNGKADEHRQNCKGICQKKWNHGDTFLLISKDSDPAAPKSGPMTSKGYGAME